LRGQIFNAFWHGPELSPLHWACLSSFVERGHRLRLFCYQAVGVPKSVEVEDARRIIPEADLFEFGGSFSAFSNLFRYKLLLEEGGWWVDADVYCLREDLPDCRYAWAREDDDFINGAILRFPAGDPSLAAIWSTARSIGRNVAIQGQLGPKLLTGHLSGRDFIDHFGSSRAFYPQHWLEAHRFWRRGDHAFVAAKCGDSCFVHLWGMMFRYLGIDPWIAPPEGSFLQHVLGRAAFPRALLPLDAETERKTLRSIQAFLDGGDYRTRSMRLLGYDIGALAALEASMPAEGTEPPQPPANPTSRS
jgi:hypothetical protein